MISLAQVLEESNQIQHRQSTDKYQENELPPGTVRARTKDTAGNEPSRDIYARPAKLGSVTATPLPGEYIIVIKSPESTSYANGQPDYIYLETLDIHALQNNGILPGLLNQGVQRPPNERLVADPQAQKPEQLTFTEKDIVSLMPLQGDSIFQSRFGSALRFSSTHNWAPEYEKTAFWSGTPGDPFVALTCGIEESMSGGQYFSIESPDDDASSIYMTTSQRIRNMSLSQPNVGKGVSNLGSYTSPQVIISSDRLIFNAKSDEIVLTSTADVKIATPAWATDMDEFFTQIKMLVDTCVKLAEGSYVYATPSGPTGPSSALSDLKKIQSAINNMQQ